MTRASFCASGLALTVLQALDSDLGTHNMLKSPSFSIKRGHGGSSAPLPVCFLPTFLLPAHIRPNSDTVSRSWWCFCQDNFLKDSVGFPGIPHSQTTPTHSF